MNKIEVILTEDGAKIPVQANPGIDAGYDLFSVEDCIIQPHERAVVSTGVKMNIPVGIYGRIAPRSGLAAKNGISVGGGVIDSGYRGIIKVILFNHSFDTVELLSGSKIAQIIFETCHYFDFNQVQEFSEKMARGENGFGSSGV